MKNKKVFMIILILFCAAAYFMGYYFLADHNFTIEKSEPTAPKNTEKIINESAIDLQKYYLLITEDDYLMIYSMPEQQLYESIELDCLWIKGEESLLKEGIRMENITEVYEFLESHMS